MKFIILTILWTISWLILGTTVLRLFPTDNIRLDMTFLAVVSIGFNAEWHKGIAPVALVGLISDAVSPAPFGILTTVYLVSFAAIRIATSIIYLHSMIARIVWISATSMLAIWLKSCLFALAYKNAGFLALSLAGFIPQTILNTVIGLAVVPFFNWYANLSWEKIFKPKGLVFK